MIHLGIASASSGAGDRSRKRIRGELGDRRKSVLVYGFLASGNIGNDASLETLLAWLGDHRPEIQVRGASNNRRELAVRYGIPSQRMSGWPRRKGQGRWEAAKATVARAADAVWSLHLAGRADAVVVPGMGVLEDSLPLSPWDFPFALALLAVATRLRRRQFVLLAIGAERASHPVTRCFFGATVRLATHVSFRDAGSRLAMGHAVGKSAVVVPDLAFAHPSPIRPRPRAKHVVIGVMAPSWGGVGGSKESADGSSYLDAMVDVVLGLIDRGNTIRLVVGDAVDAPWAERLLARVGSYRPAATGESLSIGGVDTFEGLTAEVAKGEVVVMTRYHGLICALRLGRPTISVAYAHKSDDLMNRLGLSAFSHDVRTFSPAEVVRQVSVAQEQGRGLSEAVAAAVAPYPTVVDSLLESVFTGW